jgi:hypothetical protein
MSGWHPPLHAMKHPISHLVADSDLELRDEGRAHLVRAKAQLAGDPALDPSDAGSSLDAAFEEFEEIYNRNGENWHRGAAVDIAAELAETFYLKGRIAEQAENASASHTDLGWADDFYRRAAEQATRNTSFYQEELGAFRARGLDHCLADERSREDRVRCLIYNSVAVAYAAHGAGHAILKTFAK